jgi:3,4-dihydroxy 2-butanone 4-phosphate synthase / GTP cyclohydrolase II
MSKMNTVTELIDDIRNGKMVILIDDEDRENEGDLILGTDFVTPDIINFMVKEARGLVCLALEPDQVDRLKLPLMVGDDRNYSPNKTAFTVSIEAAEGVSTGISASDRAHTIRVAANPNTKPHDIIMPGHIFPIRAQHGGVLKRAGHTEASVDLAKLAGLNPAAVICEVMKDDGSMARLPDLRAFAEKHNIKIGTIEDLIKYRFENETLVEELVEAPFDSVYGNHLKIRVFKNLLDDSQCMVVQSGEIKKDQPTLVRVYAENLLGDALGGKNFRSAMTLQMALTEIAKAEAGVLLYLRKEGPSCTMANMVLDSKLHTNNYKMDSRDYGIGAQILRKIGIQKIHLLTNHKTSKVVGLKGFGLEIEKVVSFESNETQPDETQEYIFSSLMK